jgi:phosphoserine aminotransferase
MVARLRQGLADLFSLPDGYEVVLGNGGTTVLWDALVFGLIERRSAHAVFGEFSSKFAHATAAAPHLEPPVIRRSEAGSHPVMGSVEDADVVALTHNETSTGVAMPVERPSDEPLIAVDATSAAGGMRVDPSKFDVYYFAPQKAFASDGGLWIALCSPRALERIERVGSGDRYIPAAIDLGLALDNARNNQTINTPALATIFLMVHQLEWMLRHGGLEWCAQRCERSADVLYGWAESHPLATPFVADPAMRSPVVGTIDLDAAIDAPEVSRVLRAHGIFDTEPYRKLGRNQLRIGMYPAVEPSDVGQLTRCIEFVIEALAG